jgi:hypothetical protein
MVSLYSSLGAVMNRLEISKLHDNFDVDETMTIECMEVTSEEESLKRLNNIRKCYTKASDVDSSEVTEGE